MIYEAKSELHPHQRVQYLGMTLDSSLVRAFPTEARTSSLVDGTKEFLSDPAPRAREWQVLLGHLASLEKLVPRGRLRMRSLQFQLRENWSASGDPDTMVPWSKQNVADLEWWMNLDNLAQGVPLVSPPPEVLLYTDASTEAGKLTFNTSRQQAFGRRTRSHCTSTCWK